MPYALIIDDSSTTRLYYREILEEAGFVVDEAINGIEGLEKAMNQSFDIFLVDLNMPKMDGYTFLDQVRRTIELQAVPAIMISTQAREADQTKAYAAGANLYMIKPVHAADLTTRSRLMTGQGSSLRMVS
ncbi:response regulator [Lichenifustis flavocetrariae]|uniref:Response regulator n=1 Tax=Lichenifustis flavocetrariae TaxID=2949735 RepID=A0AA41Z4J5_9HYPH|nr:response regulator [Lichenifustis flavocetrariae]MCW6512881.1 response regulator [Lichenifustis flavocetrariae]